MDVHLRRLAAGQSDVVAGWQLLAAGWTPRMIKHRVRSHGWRVVHRGVYALTRAPLTRRQLWLAAALTSPGSVLSHASAGSCWGFRPFKGSYETVTRPGSGGPRRMGGILVLRSSMLAGDVTRHAGIPITTAARALLDLAPHLPERATRRNFREALRLRTTTTTLVLETVARHDRRRGSPLLAQLATLYSRIPYERTRSDAEGRALEVLHDAGLPAPRVNIRIAGEEADLVWPERRQIVEIDGPQYHRFADEDARKERRWKAAGYTVRRLGSDAVYHEPGELLALVRRPVRKARPR
jgi:very-short-patch-repair endonuclease